ncbi:MAG: DUF1574 domain-containing protein [Leptospirales bacterium]|nr:DUF1574 domain-containing protein [Leptospirales bacterium]
MHVEASQAEGRGPQLRRLHALHLYPLLLLFLAFAADKLLFIWPLPDYFLRTASYMSYDHKQHLTNELQNYLQLPGRRKTLVIFGNSRTYSFDNEYLERRYPDWILFNFSVPGGTPDYYVRVLEEFRQRNIHPDFAFFAVTPQGYNAKPLIRTDEVMLNGLPASFVLRHASSYSVDEIANFAAKKSFWSFQYHFSIGTIQERLSGNGEALFAYRSFLADSYSIMVRNRGSTPFNLELDPPQDPDFLLATAEDAWRNFLSPFAMSEGQLQFSREMLELSRQLRMPAALLWVKVGPDLRRFKATRPVARDAGGKPASIRAVFVPAMESLAADYGASFLDMNYQPAITCDRFYDTSHLAGICMHEFTDYLMTHVRAREALLTGADASRRR